MDLDVAREFLKGSELALDNELCRPAVANAYYAMFWAARAVLKHIGITREEWSHGGLQHAFGAEIVNKRSLLPRHAGQWLHTGYDLRRKANYNLEGVGAKESRRMVHHASDFVATIAEVIER